MPDNVQQGIAIAQREGIPVDNIRKMGPIGRFFGSAAQAVTTPSRNIEMNMPQLVGQNPNDIADIIAHENTHVNQIAGHPGGLLGEFWNRLNQIGTPYGARPDEMEAYQVERKRKLARGEMAQSPSFTEPGKWNTYRGDVNLPNRPTKEQELEDYKNRIARNAGLQVGPSPVSYSRMAR